MSPGAKVFLTLTSLGVTFGVLALAASKKAGAATLPPKADEGGSTVVVPPHDNAPPAVVPSEPESGIERGNPFSVPGVQDAAEASRLLLQWLSAEGLSLISGDTAADRPTVPSDFGSKSSDLDGSFGLRAKQVAQAFQHYNGLSPEDGVLTNPLLLALRRWAGSQALPPEALPPRQSPSSPAPIVLPSPSASNAPPMAPPVVPLPPIMPQNPPVVPVPPVIPGGPAAAPPPFVPSGSPASAPASSPTSVSPVPPVTTQPAPTQAPPGATAVPPDLAAMVDALLQAEQVNGWNKVSPSVQAYQKARPPLKVDGLFGPRTALTLAETFGTIPIIRVWPAGSQKEKALQDYRAALIEIANHTTDPTRAAQLRASAQREQGQGFGVARGKAKALPEQLRVRIAKA